LEDAFAWTEQQDAIQFTFTPPDNDIDDDTPSESESAAAMSVKTITEIKHLPKLAIQGL